MIALAFLLALQQPLEIPPPRGLVSDFASVVPATTVTKLESIAADVRAKSGGEMAVVTLQDLGGREPSDVALAIGRQWGVGAKAEIGDARRNAGAVLLVVPKETAIDRRGRCYISTGQGAEGFLTDGEVASICREAVAFFRLGQYGPGIELMTVRVAEEFAREFGFQLDTSTVNLAPRAPTSAPRPPGGPRINPLFLLFAIFMVVSLLNSFRGGGRRGRRRGGFPGIVVLPPIGGGWGGGGWGGGGSWGGGGGGGGFGGFGGGGGFSGGGGGSDW